MLVGDNSEEMRVWMSPEMEERRLFVIGSNFRRLRKLALQW